MIHIKCFFVFIVFILSFTNTKLFAQTETYKKNYSLLWKIEGNSLKKPSFLFGTMHVRNKRAFEFPDSVFKVLLHADYVAFEVNFDSAAIYRMKRSMVNAEDKVLYREIFTDEELTKIWEKTKPYGFTPGKLKDMNFRELKQMLDEIEGDKESQMPAFLDVYLSALAADNGIPIHGLEDYETQLNLYDSISFEKKKKMIFSRTDSISSYLKIKNEMLAIYQSGDLGMLEEYIKYDSSYHDIIFNTRNKTMLNSMERLMKNGSVFSAVGAGHLPGEKGLIQLLRSKGYVVTPVKATFTGFADSIMHIKRISQWQAYSDSVNGYSLNIPGKYTSFKGFGGMVDMKVCYSLLQGPQYFFYSIPTSFIGVNGDAKEILNALYKRLNRLGSASYNSKKNITYKGIKGIEFKIWIGPGNEAKVQVFLVNNHVYFLMVGMSEKDYNSADANKFFNSLVFIEPQSKDHLETKDWKEIKNSKGAFTLKFPSEPYYMNKDIPNVNDSTSDPININMYTCLNPKTDEIYMFRWNDLPNGYYYENDSSVYKELFGAFLGPQYVFDREKCKALIVNNIVGYQPLDTLKTEGMKLVFRSFMRGNRNYMLIVQSKIGNKKSEAESFFSSFGFLPHVKTEYALQKIEEINVSLPGNVKKVADNNDSSWEYDFPTKTYASKDPNSGALFIAIVKTYPKYFRTEHIDSLYKELEEDLLESPKRAIETASVSNKNKLYYRTGTVLSDYTNNKLKYWIFTKANKSFRFIACVNDEMIKDKQIEDFANNISIDDIKVDFDIYSSKTELILRDLKSADSATFNNARQALSYYKFQQSDIAELHKALFYNYQDSTEIYGKTKEKLLTHVEALYDDKSTDVLVELYKNDRNTRGNVLEVLCNKASEQKELIYSLIRGYKPENIYTWQAGKVYDILIDSLAFFKAHMVDMSKLLLDNDNMYQAFVDKITEKWDTLTLSSTEKARLSENITFWYIKNTDSIAKYRPDSAQYYGLSENIISCLAYFRKLNNPAYDSLVDKLNSSESVGIQAEIIQYNMVRKIPVKPVIWQKVLNDESYGWQLINDLNKAGYYTQMPKEYQNEQKLYTIALRFHLYSEDIYVSKVKIIGSRKIQTGGKLQNFYICEFVDDTEERYTAIIGGIEFTADKLVTDNIYWNYTYEPINSYAEANKEADKLFEILESNE